MLYKITIMFLCCLICTIQINAHSSFSGISYNGYADNKIGNEEVGWIIALDNHYNLPTSTTTIGYTFGIDNSQLSKFEEWDVFNGNINTFESFVAVAAARWRNVVNFQKCDSSSSNIPGVIGHVTAKDFSDFENLSPTAVAVTISTVDNSGHKTSWEVAVNIREWSSPVNEPGIAAIAHEFGHVLGLDDLYDTNNKLDKLMFGEAHPDHVDAPADSEILAAELVLGLHTTHTWAYLYYDTVNYNTRHYKYCTGCTGVAVDNSGNTIVEGCVYNSYDICTLCSTRKGTMINSIENPEEVIE